MSNIFRHDNCEVAQAPGGFRVTVMRAQKVFFVRLEIRFGKSAPGPCSCGSAAAEVPIFECRHQSAVHALLRQRYLSNLTPQWALPPPGTAYAEIRTRPAPPVARLLPRPACRPPALPPLRPDHHGGGPSQAGGRNQEKGIRNQEEGSIEALGNRRRQEAGGRRQEEGSIVAPLKSVV
ncbi:MAG: hypothetical protein V3T83_11170 [Acidobacteriota bacterium]